MAGSGPELDKPTVPGYEILGEIGRGGMGVVYRARQLSLNRQVALKMILAGSHASQVEVARFRKEAEAIARLQHPNIVQIHEIGEHNGLPYFALELVHGPSLDEALHGQPLQPREAAQLVETLARAMHYVHLRGIIHRDLKPANVLLAPEPKLTDFGLAKLSGDGSANCVTRGILGTPNYMSPEQARGSKQIGPVADVYALGAILYETLTGRPPFQGQTSIEVLHSVGTEEPASPHRLNPKVPPDLETICLKCLHKEPAARYASALELAEELRRFVDHQPILARRVSLWNRAVKWTKRRPAVAAMLAVAAVAALLVGLLHTRHQSISQAEADQARADERREQFDRLQQARTIYWEFTQVRGDALFHWSFATLLPNADSPANLDEARKAARKALVLVNGDGDSQTAPRFNPFWSQREKDDVAAGCYQLRVVLDEPGAWRRLPQKTDGSAANFIDYLLAGHGQQRGGDYQAAAHSFQMALGLEPADFWAQCFLALCQLKLKRPSEAQASLTKCVTQKPDFIWTRLLRGLAESELNEFDGARSDFDTALQLNPSEDARYVVQVSRGLLRFRQKQWDAAVADLQGAIALKPDQFHARVSLAKVYQVQKEWQKSNEQLERVLDLHPSAPVEAECQAERSRNLCQVQQYADALKASDAAIKALPSVADAYQTRAAALLGLKRFTEALESLNTYLAKGGVPTTDFYRSRGHARMQFGDFLGAKDDDTRVLETEPSPELFAHRGWAYYFADAYKPALHDFDEALRLDPHYGDAFTGRGLGRVMLGSVDGAVEDAREALHRKPREPEMMHNIACIFALAASREERSPASEHRAAGYRDQALQAVRDTLAMVPAAERSDFWRAKIRPDDALQSIHSTEEFKLWDEQFRQR
jgi:tetratricopeptide (TPR) repeat protein